MRKIFTFLCAALMSVGMFAATVTWNSSTLSEIYLHDGQSFTKDGVTLTALSGLIDGRQGNWMGFSNDASFKFSTSLGNFTKIEITGNIMDLGGSGWTQTSPGAVWTGDANETTFGTYFENVSQIVFTIAEPTVAVTGVTLNQNEAQMTVGGETLTLTATVNPNNATDQSVSWSTSDGDVATVENGVVTAVAAGTATITVTTTDGSFTATCAVTVSNPAPAATVVTITDSDFPAWGESCTKDGVTISAVMIDGIYGNISGPGSFSTTLGNFTKIEVNANYVDISGEGWSGNSEKMTWTGNASSVSFIGDINGDEEGNTLKFTIEPASTPEPQGEVTVVFAANNKTVERTVTLPHTFKCSWDNGMDGPDELDIIIHELYNDYYYCNSNMNASGSDQVEVGTEEAPKNDYITIKGVFEGTVTVTGDYFDWITGEEGAHNYSITISIKGDEPEPTAVENVQTNQVQAIKFFRDGQLLIEKNGKIYNVQGVEVR